MILANDLIQGLRPHPVRQRGFMLHPFFKGMVKEVHALILPCRGKNWNICFYFGMTNMLS